MLIGQTNIYIFGFRVHVVRLPLEVQRGALHGAIRGRLGATSGRVSPRSGQRDPGRGLVRLALRLPQEAQVVLDVELMGDGSRGPAALGARRTSTYVNPRL